MGRRKASKSRHSQGKKNRKRQVKRHKGRKTHRKQRGGSFFGFLDHVIKHGNDPGMPTLRQSANRRLNGR